MASNLYETLGVGRDATPEQIRKAYKKMALQTHPDRLPPNASQADKTASEEHFRKVNNAYEVLNNEENRKLYDRHGVWPPTQPEYDAFPRNGGPSRHHAPRHHPSPMGSFRNPFDDPFFRQPYPSFVFTDPFVLFESVFGDFHRNFDTFRRSTPYESRDPFYEPENPFERMHRMHTSMVSNFMSEIDRDNMGMFNGFPGRSRFSSMTDGSPFGGSSNGTRWASESHTVTMVNGVTQSVHKRRDWEGNTHVTRTLPDGREIYTINGVEQPSAPALPYYHNDRGQLPAPPPVGQIHSTGGSHYPQNTPPYPVQPNDHHRHHSRPHSRHNSDSRPVIPGSYADHQGPPVIPESYDRADDDHRQRKRWWRGW